MVRYKVKSGIFTLGRSISRSPRHLRTSSDCILKTVKSSTCYGVGPAVGGDFLVQVFVKLIGSSAVRIFVTILEATDSGDREEVEGSGSLTNLPKTHSRMELKGIMLKGICLF
ncbi:hypothetical protein HAV15_003325 [Penicillium sp. str. |nr:hypothetical protein HAV15_003325 [Penicillium sp. str. \